MLDDGRPLTTEANTLRDIVLPPSFFNKILSVAGVSGYALRFLLLSEAEIDCVQAVHFRSDTILITDPMEKIRSQVRQERDLFRYSRGSRCYHSSVCTGVPCCASLTTTRGKDRNGTLLTSNIWGKINCNSQLSGTQAALSSWLYSYGFCAGTPDLLLSFTNAKAFADPSFHSCVR